MPRINPARPAAVYAPDLPGAQDALLPVLTERRLYVLDRRTESLEDTQKPVLDRPVLRMHLWHAHVGPEFGAAVFITDSLATISGDPVERAAVVGALLHSDCEVVVDGQVLAAAWYQERVRHIGFDAVYKLISALLNFAGDAGRLWGPWSTGPTDGLLTVLPTSLGLTHDASRMRIKELAELEGLPASAIAQRLQAEGHSNPQGRHVWYPQAVRDAYKAGL